jgi:hypothetical protein
MEAGPDGKRRQRSVELGDSAVVEAVVGWLRGRRREYQAKVEAEKRSREEAVAKERRAEETRTNLRTFCMDVGQSRRQRQDLGREFDAIANDLRQVALMCTRAKVFGPLPPRPAGRPLKRRLW